MPELHSDGTKPDAFILSGAFSIVCRDPIYISDLVRRGLRVLLMTPARWRDTALERVRDPSHPASAVTELAFVDGSVEHDGSFMPGAIACAKDWRDRYHVVGVYAVGETLLEPTGLVADFFGVPFPGLRAVRACRSKFLQRWYLPEMSPHWVLIPPGSRTSFDRAAVRFPAVIKPSTRHSSLGVQAVADLRELDHELATYDDTEAILVEQRVAGQEFSVESLVQNGKTIFSSVTHKETNETQGRYFVELAHTIPSVADEATEAVSAANELLLSRLGVENGITHAEWRAAADGRVHLMEIAARTPGDGIMGLYRLATGQRMEPELLRIAMGEPASYQQPRRYARQVYLEHTPGTLDDVTVDWPGVRAHWIASSAPWPEMEPGAPDDPPALRAVFVTRRRGTELHPLRSSDDRAVTFFVDAPSLTALDEIDRRVRKAVCVVTVPPHSSM
jgi:hypothetical protein